MKILLAESLQLRPSRRKSIGIYGARRVVADQMPTPSEDLARLCSRVAISPLLLSIHAASLPGFFNSARIHICSCILQVVSTDVERSFMHVRISLLPVSNRSDTSYILPECQSWNFDSICFYFGTDSFLFFNKSTSCLSVDLHPPAFPPLASIRFHVAISQLPIVSTSIPALSPQGLGGLIADHQVNSYLA
jgi:hypothetical protein